MTRQQYEIARKELELKTALYKSEEHRLQAKQYENEAKLSKLDCDLCQLEADWLAEELKVMQLERLKEAN